MSTWVGRCAEAVSFIILTEDQAETDRLWNVIVSNGGQESMCGWCKDRCSAHPRSLGHLAAR
ncbi:MAG TPA: VOC family protein [Terracidiphilus sp.]